MNLGPTHSVKIRFDITGHYMNKKKRSNRVLDWIFYHVFLLLYGWSKNNIINNEKLSLGNNNVPKENNTVILLWEN